MKIVRIDTFNLKAPLGEDRFWSSQCRFSHRKSLLIRVETDDGLIGWGEGGQYGPAEPVAATVHSVFAPMLLGENPCMPEVHWEQMYTHTRDFGRKGPVLEALSGLDIALWDIFGKQQGLPIHVLMGGAFRNRVQVYATGLYYRGNGLPTLESDLPMLRQEAARYAKAGFPAVKMKVGLLSPLQDLERVAAVREAVGKNVLIMVDANHAYQGHTACYMAKGLERFDTYWFEEPVVPEDLGGYRKVKAATYIPIAGGECEYTRFGFVKWISGGLLDIVQPDLCCAGGFSEVRRIATLASTFHVQCIPHVWGSGVALAAGLQMLAQFIPCPHTASPQAPYNEPMLEWDTNKNPLRTELLVEPICPVKGEVEVPAGPGLGIEINQRVLERYLVEKKTSSLKAGSPAGH